MMPWFRRKTFGYGWTPASWEGWVAMAIFTAGIVGVATRASELGPVTSAVLIGALTAVLLVITAATSEKDSDR
jgi:hypothetical protein